MDVLVHLEKGPAEQGILPWVNLTGPPPEKAAKDYEQRLDNYLRDMNRAESQYQWNITRTGGVVRIFPPDHKGRVEVLYLDRDDVPHTAWLNGDNTVITICEGWDGGLADS